MSIYPATLNFNGKSNQGAPLYIGDDFYHQFTFIDGAGDPIDKSGATYVAQVKRSKTGNVVAEFDVTVSGDDNNIVELFMSHENTILLDPGTYTWDLQETDDLVLTRVAGILVAKRGVSE